MKKFKSIIASMLSLSIISASALATPVKYTDPAMLDKTDPAYYEPYPIALNATSYTPWFTMYHMQTADHASRGIRGGEGGQMVMSLAVSPVNPNLMLMGSDMAGIWRSVDGGENWYSVTDNNNFRSVNDIVFHPTLENVAFSLQGTKGTDSSSLGKLNSTKMDGLYRTTDGGHSWEHVLPRTMLSSASTHGVVCFDDAGNVYALTNAGVFKSTDIGENWEHLGVVDAEGKGGIYSLWVSGDGKTMVAATGKSGISVSTSGGIFWKQANGGLKASATSFAVDPTNEEHWYAIFSGEKERLFHSYDRGATWEPIGYYSYADKNIPYVVRTLYIPEKNVVRLILLYSAMSRPIRYSDDGGKTWIEPKSPYKDTFTKSTGYYVEGIGICETNNNIVIYSYGDNIYKSTDGGATFKYSNGGYSCNYARDFDIDSKGNMWIAFTDRGVVRSDAPYQKGTYPTMTRFDIDGTIGQVEIDPNNPEHVFITKGGWTSQTLMESHDYGKTWKTRSEVPKANFSIFEYHKENPDKIYTNQYTSYDNGRTWQKNTKSISSVSPVDSDVLYGLTGNVIRKSIDGGNTWTDVTEIKSQPKVVRADVADKDTVWVGCYNGDVVKVTGTSKKTFNKNNGLVKFGDAVNTVAEIGQNPKNPNHLLMGMTCSDGATKTVGLYETYDGGHNWHVVKGMWAARIVQTIEFSPVSDEVFLGTCSNGNIIYDYNVYKQYLDGTLKVDKSNEVLLPGDSDKVRVMMNGMTLSFDQTPFILNGRTMVPFRKIFEEMGASVEWIGETHTVKATKSDTVIELQIGSATAKVNGAAVTLDAAPDIYNSRTMVPLRFVSENLDAKVEWNGNLRRVEIKTN